MEMNMSLPLQIREEITEESLGALYRKNNCKSIKRNRATYRAL